jgi:phage terminase small subunit
MPRPMGRPPKPLEQKLRTGNPGKRALPDRSTLTVLPAAITPPEPHRPLGPVGRAMWDRVWEMSVGWVAANVDAEWVQVLCETYDERQQQRVKVLKDGDRLERVALRQLDAQVTGMLSDLGFNPTSRARLMVAEVKVDSAVDDFFGPAASAR